MPISLTHYRLSDHRLFIETGLLRFQEEEIMLYKIDDLHLTITLGQRLFGVGNIQVISTDPTCPNAKLINVKNPRRVKELIYQYMKSAKREYFRAPMAGRYAAGGRYEMGAVNDLDDGFL